MQEGAGRVGRATSAGWFGRLRGPSNQAWESEAAPEGAASLLSR
jgi:hypothetical protein